MSVSDSIFFMFVDAARAGARLRGSHPPNSRPPPPALVHRQRTTRMKDAARRRIDRARHLASHRLKCALGLDRRVRHRHRAEQGRRVGMQWMIKKLVTLGKLDDAAEIHDGDTLTE